MSQAGRGRRACVSNGRWVWLAFACLVVVRLVLSSQHEILAYTDDDKGYAETGLTPFWSWTYSAYSHVRQPVYPLFVWASSSLGVSVRHAIEAVWIVTTGVVLAGVRRCGMHPALAVLVAAHMLLHPWSFWLLDRLLQDTLYTPAFVGATVAAAAGAASNTRRDLVAWGAIGACWSSVAASTRPETVLVFGVLGLAACVIAVGWAAGKLSRRLAIAQLAAAAIVPCACVLLTIGVIKSVNQRSTGLALTQDLSSPGMQDLFDTLLAIPPEHATLRVPIMRDVREAAYQASPKFASLKPWIDGPGAAPGFLLACQRATGAEGEYGSWTLWAVRRAAWMMKTDWKDAAEVDAFYHAAAREIRESRRSAGLAMRRVPLPFVAPEWELYQVHGSQAIARSWDLVRLGGFLRPPDQRCTPALRKMFDQAAHRSGRLVRALENRRYPSAGWLSRESIDRVDRVKRRIGEVSIVLTHAWLVAGVLGLLAGMIGLWTGVIRWRWAVLMIVLAGALIARTALVVLLDMNGIPAQARYLFPSALLLIVFGAAGAQAFAAVAVRAIGARRQSEGAS